MALEKQMGRLESDLEGPKRARRPQGRSPILRVLLGALLLAQGHHSRILYINIIIIIIIII